MKNFHLRIVAIVLCTSFGVRSGSFAATDDDIKISKNVGDLIREPAESRPPLWSDAATGAMCEMNEAAAESAALGERLPFADVFDPDESDAAALNWLENEMQMSIDPTDVPQGITPDYNCMDPPYTCPSNVRCPDLGACVVTSCGMGGCSICPVKNPGWIIRSWCAYGCMKGSKVVGGAFGFWVRGLGWKGPLCFPG